jgi:hypothetical protein
MPAKESVLAEVAVLTTEAVPESLVGPHSQHLIFSISWQAFLACSNVCQ